MAGRDTEDPERPSDDAKASGDLVLLPSGRARGLDPIDVDALRGEPGHNTGPDLEPQFGIGEGQELGDDFVWFDPETLARRSEIGGRPRGWWSPGDASESGAVLTPCWGPLHPAQDPSLGHAAPVWNDPKHPFVAQWSRASMMAICSEHPGDAYALMEQLLESMVVANLFEREPVRHRALLVSARSPAAWLARFGQRWQHTRTPSGHPVQATATQFAARWLIACPAIWERDEVELLHWLGQEGPEQVVGVHLPEDRDLERNRHWVASMQRLCSWAAAGEGKLIVAGSHAGLGALNWDPRDRVTLTRYEQDPQPKIRLSWGEVRPTSVDMAWHSESGIYELLSA